LVSLLQVRNNGTQRDIFRSVDLAAYRYSTRSEIRLVSERTQRGGAYADRTAHRKKILVAAVRYKVPRSS